MSDAVEPNDRRSPAIELKRAVPEVSVVDRVMFALISRYLSRTSSGRLTVRLPSGATRLFAGRQPGESAELDIVSSRFFWHVARRGTLGFAESRLKGNWTSPDCGALLRFFIDNSEAMSGASSSRLRASLTDRLAHRTRENTRRGSRRNIAAHYDLGNDFYRLWLDPGMTYSSAVFAHPGEPLEAAQERKNTQILDWLGLGQPSRILEIGCGWGGFAEFATRAGHHLTGLTLSREQLEYARNRVGTAGLADRTDLRFEDYRDHQGRYDAIASIEMIEAVGERHWPAYFEKLAQCLKPGGVAVLQAITIPQRYYEEYRRNPDFIQRYIFPGGMLPTRDLIEQHAGAAGFRLDRSFVFSQCYARTLLIWLENFHRNWPAIAALGFDERFRRMWEYYLIYCAAGFERNVIEVGHYRLVRP